MRVLAGPLEPPVSWRPASAYAARSLGVLLEPFKDEVPDDGIKGSRRFGEPSEDLLFCE